jgi:hypothetical protein
MSYSLRSWMFNLSKILHGDCKFFGPIHIAFLITLFKYWCVENMMLLAGGN